MLEKNNSFYYEITEQYIQTYYQHHGLISSMFKHCLFRSNRGTIIGGQEKAGKVEIIADQ